MTQKSYNPDVLTCLANLSNDEVFTPPPVVNAMLDLLPVELWSDPEATFLDPVSKTGVFLREMAKRLMAGLAEKIPDERERANHIFARQLFAIPITSLTALVSRRSVYCSKVANGRFSVCREFKDEQGNIRYAPTRHTWHNGKCGFCGASEAVFGHRDGEGLESHAYQFIHTDKPEEIFNMKFDVIIGNPPYQLEDGGNGASAIPIYHRFIQQAKSINPRFLIMITPSRWFSGGRGLDTFRDEMLNDRRIRVIHDFPNASECFTGVEIKGGVSYFLWDRENKGDCEVVTHQDKMVDSAIRPLLETGADFFIRYNKLVGIYRKVKSFNDESFATIVSSMKPFGLRGDFFKDPTKYNLPNVSDAPIIRGIRIWGLDEKQNRVCKYAARDYPLPRKENLYQYKMFITRNIGSGKIDDFSPVPIFAEPGDACTETFLTIGPFPSEEYMYNCFSYIKTRFFRIMVALKKIDQGASKSVYQCVPLQDFSKPWTDEQLYSKYNLTADEISFIESMIRPMD